MYDIIFTYLTESEQDIRTHRLASIDWIQEGVA